MADPCLPDAAAPRRPRRGPPPRLYVIARDLPVPWMQLRRLEAADRAALAAHLRRVAAAEPWQPPLCDAEGLAAACAAIDFSRLLVLGAVTGRAILAAAYAAPGHRGWWTAVSEDPRQRERGLGAMLLAQLNAEPVMAAPRGPERALLRRLRALSSFAESASRLAATG
ncbi:hypothetical protein [Roseicella frigidaeris]|uniref:N-acetyltransferase domain-containing protein n=1 Tax=Roseicella frigidaeris TaxID=2230885 RepID=A0A327MCF2_9PROT|nr:hypothetical protein [Roseicella frigidaeris]RAI60317.1 hypothetical protein DOO78_04405 [Roseicella frigidaeris]